MFYIKLKIGKMTNIRCISEELHYITSQLMATVDY